MTETSFPEFKSQAWPTDPAVPPGQPDDLVSPYIPPNPAVRQPPITEQEAKSKRAGFIELILRTVVEVLFGIFTPSKGSAKTQFGQWAAGVVDATVGFVYKVFLIGDIIEIIAQKEDGDLNDLGSAINAIINGAQELFDGFVSGFLGWLGSGFQPWQAKQAAIDQGQTVASFAALLAGLKTDQDRRGNSGNAATVTFVDRPDANSLGSDFSQTYDGAGPALLGIRDGKATWIPGASVISRRTCLARYNAKKSLTDQQMVGVAFASAPTWFNALSRGYNYIFARVNDAGTSYIYVEFGRYHCELGCVVNGEQFVWDRITGNTQFSAFTFRGNSIYWLQAGTSGGDRIFRVLQSDFTPLITHTEVGTVSQLGSDYRSTGFGGGADATPIGSQLPGRVLSFGFADNTPAPTLGSFARVYRATATDTSASSADGDRALPANSFDTIDRITPDVVWNGTTFTVSVSGSYLFTWRAESDTTLSSTGVVPTAIVNGTVYARGRGGTFADIGDTVSKILGDSFPVYLEATDEIEAGIWTSANVSLDFQGGAQGSEMFMCLQFIGNEPPVPEA